jgi:hypothetical protein
MKIHGENPNLVKSNKNVGQSAWRSEYVLLLSATSIRHISQDHLGPIVHLLYRLLGFFFFSFSVLVFILRTAIPPQSFQFQIRRTPFYIIRYYIQASADTLSSNQLRPMPPISSTPARNCVELYVSVRRESCNFCSVCMFE